MRRGSLKTLCIGELSKPDQVVQVLEELSHCTQLRELELKLKILQLDLGLSQSDKVRCNHKQYHRLSKQPLVKYGDIHEAQSVSLTCR